MAVRLNPDSAEFNNNLGVVLNKEGFFETAIRASRKAIFLYPDYVEAHNNVGTALMELGRFSEAKEAFERAIAIDPNCVSAHLNVSLILMMKGEFTKGWLEYEWRWKDVKRSTPLRHFPYPFWKKATDDVKRLLVWGEQGVGDEVQFAGFIREIMTRGTSVIIECDRRLVGLFERSFPKALILGRTDSPNEILKDQLITHQIPMASIPKVLGLNPNSMAFRKPFLVADREIVMKLRKEYNKGKEKHLIGISWRSGNRQEGPKRSIELEHWEPIFKVPNTRFVSLQYGEHSHELNAAEKMSGVSIINDPRIDPLKNLDVFAAQVAAMDLVISVDISTVHFAGALGVNVWTLLPTVPDWRWGLEGIYTSWYSSMRLFRQKERGKWRPVIQEVAEELFALFLPDGF
jgi:hypothetical protein